MTRCTRTHRTAPSKAPRSGGCSHFSLSLQDSDREHAGKEDCRADREYRKRVMNRYVGREDPAAERRGSDRAELADPGSPSGAQRSMSGRVERAGDALDAVVAAAEEEHEARHH